jgi:hypothetical protein
MTHPFKVEIFLRLLWGCSLKYCCRARKITKLVGKYRTVFGLMFFFYWIVTVIGLSGYGIPPSHTFEYGTFLYRGFMLA